MAREIQSAPELSSSTMQRFERLREVNRGGIGCIDAAYDPVIGRKVAIKVLRPELRGEKLTEEKFAEEAQITGQLEHPNIVPIYDLCEDRNGPFIVMKLVRGKSLTDLVNEVHDEKRGPENLPRLVQIVLRLCDAVAFAHSRGVIHCDLKPDNVMVGDYGQVYLMDWGVALLVSQRKARSDADTSSERVDTDAPESLVRVSPRMDGMSSKVWGTPAYMAPEQLKARVNEIDERTDVYGLGGILFEILTGKPPNDWQRLLGPALNNEPVTMPATSALWQQLPPELCRIALKALAPRSEHRYQTVEDLRIDLEQFLQGGGWFETCEYREGESIVTEGEPGDRAYIIERGHCDVFKGVADQRVFIRRLGPGDVFGETAVLTREPRTASVVAATNVTLKLITGDSLNRELDRNPWLAAFVRSLANLFRETDERLSHPNAPSKDG
ncbi:MAG TPA: protein kinase [Polyangiaceae bacterium]|nr:protein kinase [Polyangiaceae bacterium]